MDSIWMKPVTGPRAWRRMLRLWLKFPKPWPIASDFPDHAGYRSAPDVRTLVEA
jgi:hypothetical protein